MIVLDTNQLDYLRSPRGPVFVLLESIAEHSAQDLALPEMVLTEHLAHHRHEVETHAKAARDAVRALNTLDAHPRPVFNTPDPDQSVQARRTTMEEIFTVLRTPDGAADDGMVREANRLRPADTAWEKKGAGGRDVVVWLSVLAAMEQLGADEQLLFVSADGDFTDKQGELHSELREEVVARGLDPARLRVFRDVLGLLAGFAEKTEVPGGLKKLLDAATTDKSLTLSVAIGAANEVKQRLGGELGSVIVTPIGLPRLTLQSDRGRTMAYRMDENTWISVESTWKGEIDFAVIAVAQSTTVPVSPVTFTVKASVLIRIGPDCPNGTIALIRRGRLRIEQVVFSAL